MSSLKETRMANYSEIIRRLFCIAETNVPHYCSAYKAQIIFSAPKIRTGIQVLMFAVYFCSKNVCFGKFLINSSTLS